MASLRAGSRLVVVIERAKLGSPAAVLRAVGRTLMGNSNRSQLNRLLAALGAEVEEVYAVWPSGRAPRIAYRLGDDRSLAWVQRSGVLGGGGRSLWRRMLLRSRLLTPLFRLLVPAYAVVVKRPSWAR